MSADTVAEPACESRWAEPVVGFLWWLKNLSDTQYVYLLLTPVFALLGIVAIYPLLWTFELPLYTISTDLSSARFTGFDNYVALFTGERNRFLPGGMTFFPTGFDAASLLDSTLIITLIFTVASVLFETLIGLEQALVLDQDFYDRWWVRTVIITPWAVPIVIQRMMFFLMLGSSVGFAAPMLADLGIVTPTSALNGTVSATLIIVVADIWGASAFMALLTLVGPQSINHGLYDVARTAGASKWQQLRYITFPLILPTIGAAVLLRLVQAIRVYGIIDIISSYTVVSSFPCMVISAFDMHEGTSVAIALVTVATIGVAMMRTIL